MRSIWNFHTAGRLVFGCGAVKQIGRMLARREWRRVFVVADRMLADAGIVEQIERPLSESSEAVEMFLGGEPEPSIAAAERAIEAARRFRPKVVVGLGGGSNMDLSKIVANVVTHGGSPADYFGFDRVPGPVLPLVCVPTTSGTGSEVSHAAVLTDTANEMKVSTLSQFLRPSLAVVDPELTFSCPARVTADSGIDALTHAIEAFTATDALAMPFGDGDEAAYEGRSPISDLMAEHAIRLIGRHLVAAVREPHNRIARESMSLAATLAGIAFSNAGVALVHALEYPIGGALHCSHGAGNGLLLPYVMRFNLPERLETFAAIADLLGESIEGLSEFDAAQLAISAVEKLRREIGIPERIRDLGGREDQLPTFAAKAFPLERLRQTNPRAATQEDLLSILRSAF